MSDDDVFYRISTIMNVDPAEIAKIVHDYIERDIGCGTLYDRFNSPPPPIYIGPVKVKSLKQRLEEATMHEDCYFCIKRGICTKDVPKPCKYRYTEEERIADQASDQYGAILNDTYLPKTYRKETNEMKATSTETFHDIIAIDFELQTFPNPDVEDKFIVSATNRDDIFCFVFEGLCLRDACRNAGLFTGWEKDQKIKELEKELKILKDEKIKEKNRKINDLYHQLHLVKRDKERLTGGYKYLKTMNDEYSERINALQRMYNFEKAANEAQHKFFVNYAGKGTEIEFNYAIRDTDEVSYVILNKKEYEEKIKILENQNEKILDTNRKLQEKIFYLEGLKTPTIENFSDEKTTDNVNHPSHYTGRYECIDVMQDIFGNEATDNFCLCNAFKYIWRANKKNGLEDVKKAVWYLNKYIEEAENGVSKGE